MRPRLGLAVVLLHPLLAALPGAAAPLPHAEEVATGVHAAGFADRHRSANCGWVAAGDHTLLVDLPRGVDVSAFLAEVARTTGRPARVLALTRLEEGDDRVVKSLLDRGVRQVLASPAVRRRLLAGPAGVPPAAVRALAATAAVGTTAVPADYIPLDGVTPDGGGAVHLPGRKVLFGGPLVVNGPRARLPGSDTARWLEALRGLERLGAARVVPGFGTWGGPEVLARQRRFLAELRRQVGHAVAQGRPPAALAGEVRLPADCLAWAPYDSPTAQDVGHVYRELTAPAAPFHGRPPREGEPRPHALVLIGDGPHEPGAIEEGLRPVFEATGVVAHFTVDVRALSAENLSRVRLLVILRDGLQRPRPDDRQADHGWMTPAQERAVVRFVEGGGGFLNLHNGLALYPGGGPYLKLLGGRYTTHGPLERFRVEVADRRHPVTRGVHDFSVADEQHAPVPDKEVHLLLRSRSDDGKVAAAGWAREPGRGRLCHLANGHTRGALLHPMYQRLLRNAVGWCLRRGG